MRKKRHRRIRLFAALILVTGVCVLVYPHFCQYIYKIGAQQVIDEFNEKFEHQNPEDLEWLYQKIVTYNQELYQNRQEKLVDPFSYTQVDFSLTSFGFPEDMIGSVTIPAMNISLPVYLGASTENLKLGAAHLTQTSLPVGGENTNAVIAGHRGYSKAAMFRDITKLKPGDPVIVTNFYTTLHYEVISTAIIEPTEVDKILIQPGRDLLTLLTCHPYRSNRQRYVVYCERKQ